MSQAHPATSHKHGDGVNMATVQYVGTGSYTSTKIHSKMKVIPMEIIEQNIFTNRL